jgi:hypothetical protein
VALTGCPSSEFCLPQSLLFSTQSIHCVRTRPLSKPIPISELNPEDQTIAGNVYDRIFWLSYIANVLLVTANAMTFRFAEFVKEFGGTESIAGFIVSCGYQVVGGP